MTAQHMFEALEQTIKKNVDASLPQTIAARRRLIPSRAPAPPGAPAPARTPAPPPAPAPPQTPAPEQRKPRRVVRHPPEVDFKGLIVGYLLSIDEKLGEELQPVSDPSETLRLSLSLLSQDDW